MSAHPWRVLWLAKGLGRGGAEQLLVSSLPSIDRDRFDVEVAYCLPWKDALVASIAAAGVPVHCLGQRGPLDVSWVGRLRALHRSRRYDLVHTHMPVPAAAARLALGAPRPALLHTEHNMWNRYRLPTRLLNAATYHRNAAVIAVSDAVADSARAGAMGWLSRGVPIDVVHHGIDPTTVRRGEAARAESRRRLGLEPDAFVIGTVGNFTPKKDHATMVEAFARLRSERADARLVLVGTGPVEADVRARVRDLGVDRSVVFAGLRDDVPELLPGFDVFLLTSTYEGLSIALLEALAAGVACVATRVGGIPEVIDDGVDGVLISPRDPAATAGVLEALAGDPRRRGRLAEAGIRTASAWGIARAVDEIQAVYARVLEHRAPVPQP